MDFYRDGYTVRVRVRQLLATTDQPMTAADIADLVDTTQIQSRRALRQLEAQGAAVRRAAAGGCYVWRAR